MRNEAVITAESWLFSTMCRGTALYSETSACRSRCLSCTNSNSLTWSSIHSSLISSRELDVVNNEGLWQGGEGKSYRGADAGDGTDRQIALLHSLPWNPSRPAQSPLLHYSRNDPLKMGPFLYLKSTCPCHYFQWGTDEQGYLDSGPNLRWPLGLLCIPLYALRAQSCLTLCNPMDCSPPGSPVHGLLQARILDWVGLPFSRVLSRLRDRTCISYISCVSKHALYC